MMPSPARTLHDNATVAGLPGCRIVGRGMLHGGGTRWKCSSFNQTEPLALTPLRTGLHPMDQLSGYAHRPFRFVLRYLRHRPASHLIILSCVIGAVACSTGTQYGVKF